uniref:Uncharacterized protein n=2 Tax=Brassica oleracea TaxID=3712 RepID=A0A0D2ZPM4_BRAOL|nr:unnamed protein product [Brassica oleracea]
MELAAASGLTTGHPWVLLKTTLLLPHHLGKEYLLTLPYLTFIAQRLHSQRYQSADSIIFSLNRLVKDRLLSFRPSSPAFSSSLMQLWLSTE